MANKIFIFVLLFLVFSLGVNAAKDSNFNNVQDAEQPQITNRITIFTGLPIIGIAFNPILGFITKQNTIQTNTNTINAFIKCVCIIKAESLKLRLFDSLPL